MRIYFILFISLLVASCSSDNEANDKEPKETVEVVVDEPDSTAYYDSLYKPYHFHLDTFFRSRFKSRSFNGSVLFARKGNVIFKENYGLANVKTRDTITFEHTFQLASASKPITAIAALQLYEQGKIRLTDDIKKYIPEVPYEGITIHQLLSHRSGMSQYTHFCDAPDSIWPDKHQTIHNIDVIKIMKDIVPMINYAPDVKFYYCNTNYMLLATLVEKVSGLPFREYLKEHIFDVAGMPNTRLYERDNDSLLVKPAKGYNGAYNPTIDIYLNGVVGDKGIYSNTADMLALDKALFKGELIHDSLIQKMITPMSKNFKVNQNYGYGFRMFPETEYGKLVYHSGWWKGFRSNFIHVLDTDECIIWLSNIKRGKHMNAIDLKSLLVSVDQIVQGKN